MNRKVNIIFDVSGSFTAEGKSALQTNMLMTLISATARPDFINEELEIAFLEWGEDLYDINLEDVYANYTENCMQFGGMASLDKLKEFIDAVEPQSRFLLLSDGLFSGENLETLNLLLREKEDILVSVAIGPDADSDSLSRISRPISKCYKPENILTALEEICFRSYEVNNSFSEHDTDVTGERLPRRVRL